MELNPWGPRVFFSPLRNAIASIHYLFLFFRLFLTLSNVFPLFLNLQRGLCSLPPWILTGTHQFKLCMAGHSYTNDASFGQGVFFLHNRASNFFNTSLSLRHLQLGSLLVNLFWTIVQCSRIIFSIFKSWFKLYSAVSEFSTVSDPLLFPFKDGFYQCVVVFLIVAHIVFVLLAHIDPSKKRDQ